MRILVLHKNKFERMTYATAFDHQQHDVTYIGLRGDIQNIPEHIRCEKFILEDEENLVSVVGQKMNSLPPFDRLITRHEKLIIPASKLRDEFGIAGMTHAQALRVRDKVIMKLAVQEHNIRAPKFTKAVDAKRTQQWTGKTVVKPTDGAGSQGISMFDSYQDAVNHLDNSVASQKDLENLELEEYLEGPVWHIDGYMNKGKAICVQSSQYVGTCFDFECGKYVGSVHYDNIELQEWALDCVRAIAGEHSSLTFHLEAIMTSEGPVFLEVAARCGGAYIVDAFILRHSINLHTLDMASDVDDKLASRHLPDKERTSDFYGWFAFPGHKHNGRPVNVIANNNILEHPFVVSYMKRPPDKPTTDFHSYRAENLTLTGIVKGPDPDELTQFVNEVFNEVTIEAID